MKSTLNNILTINAGSSSIKFAMYQNDELLSLLLSGSIENINFKNTKISFYNLRTTEQNNIFIELVGFDEAVNYLLNWLELQIGFDAVNAVGHRVVHGMQHTEAQIISPTLISELKKIISYDPEHLPNEIKLIEIFAKRYPSFIQIACFDTAFHTTMPSVAKLLPIPRRYLDKGIKRYGFHGLSYTYLMQKLQSITEDDTTKDKIILAHLGNGASLAAVKNNKCVDTSMGFTPTSGLMMGTRCGDLDPSVAWYLMQVEKLSPQNFNQLINHESGLLGISETTSDMREIIKNKNNDTRACDAFEMFCYQTKKYIGAYAAALEGLDTLVFSGGIGEHSPEVRNQICDGLGFLGIVLDEVKNMNNDIIISDKNSKVTVYVIKTNEELMIAEMVAELIKSNLI